MHRGFVPEVRDLAPMDHMASLLVAQQHLSTTDLALASMARDDAHRDDANASSTAAAHGIGI